MKIYLKRPRLSYAKKLTLSVAALLLTSAVTSHADNFGTGSNTFSINFTSVGNAGNASDYTGYGAVPYDYGVGTYDISENQVDSAIASGLANVTAGAWTGDQPAANISWYGAAAFVNWLNTSQGYQAAYNLTFSGGNWSMALWTPSDSGYNSNNVYRNANAEYFLPSVDEWYKAAYYDPSLNGGSGGYNLYPTGGNDAPTAVTGGTNFDTAVYNDLTTFPSDPSSVYLAGGLSPYGTIGQGGNVWQWEEGVASGPPDPAGDRAINGGSYYSLSNDLQASYPNSDPVGDTNNAVIGFRVARLNSVPEPSTYALCALGGITFLIAYRRRMLLRAR